jgi:hypothetical protein
MTATLARPLTLMDDHCRGLLKEVLLPRATFTLPCGYEFTAIMAGRRSRQLDYGFHCEPTQRRQAPGAATTGFLTAFYLYSGELLQDWWLLCGFQQSWPACARHPQLLSNWFSFNPALHLTGICSGIMVRRRGKPRRGSAWEAHKAQRRREEELERALALASSILRKKARVERREALKTIVEHGAGCSRTVKESEHADLFFGCVVEEDLSIGDLICNEMPSARETLNRPDSKSAPTKDDDLNITKCISNE